MRTLRGPALLTVREVAMAFRVHPGTASRWGTQGILLRARTPGNHGRYYAVEVDALLRGEPPEAARALAEAERDRLSPATVPERTPGP